MSSIDRDHERLIDGAFRRHYRRGDVVSFRDAEPKLYVVEDGLVALNVVHSNGATAMPVLLSSGQAYFEAPQRGGRRRACSLLALTSCRIAVAHRHPHARAALFDRLAADAAAAHLHSTTDFAMDVLFVPAERRVLKRLTDLCARAGDAPTIDIPITQEDLAALTGTTRPTVNRVVQGVAAEGIVEVGRGRIRILDRAALASRLAD